VIAVNGIVFFFELSLPQRTLEGVFYHLGLVPARYTHPSWAVLLGIPADDLWPFVTNIFLHGGWLHFVGNMWMLWLFGDNVEDRMGHSRFLLFYLACGVAASFAHFLFNPHSTVPAIGASGAIAGVMGAYMLLFPTARVVTLVPFFFVPYFIEVPAVFYLGLWFISQLSSGAFSLAAPGHAAGIAWWAHVGGFVTGMVLMPVVRKRRRSYRAYYDDELYRFRFPEW